VTEAGYFANLPFVHFAAFVAVLKAHSGTLSADREMRPGFGREGVAVTVVVHLKKCRDHRVARIFRPRE
jgi:hypothetical protein